MTPTEIKQLLEQYGLRPVHDRGQNFLLDDGVIEKMLAAADIKPGDKVLEIGPGLGVLTDQLLEAGADVLAVELDPGLARIMRDRHEDNPKFQLVEGDFLSFDLQDLSTKLGSPGEGEYKIVANLPYAITSDAIKKMLTTSPKPHSVTIMIQREVAERATAQPPKSGLLSIVLQTYGQAKIVTRVPAGSFWPAPKVESAVLHISLYSSEKISETLAGIPPEKFLKIVSQGFAQKRKQLKNTLGKQYDKKLIEQAFENAQLEPSERPERVTFEQWVTVVKTLLR